MSTQKKQRVDAGMTYKSNGTPSLDAIAKPFSALAFFLVLDCLKLYPQVFPERTSVIASILNQVLPPSQHIEKLAVFNLIEKLKHVDKGESAAALCLRRPPVEILASNTNSRYIAFPRFSKFLVCNSQLTWINRVRKPFFFPDQGSPERGIVHEKFCKDCNTLFSVSYYCPKGSDERRPYPASADHPDWLELSGETLVDMQLLRQHDNDL